MTTIHSDMGISDERARELIDLALPFFRQCATGEISNADMFKHVADAVSDHGIGYAPMREVAFITAHCCISVEHIKQRQATRALHKILCGGIGRDDQ
jgi:hypothetical protein